MLRRVLAQQVLPASNYYDGEDYYRENEGARGRDYNPPKHPYFGHEHELDGSSEGSSDDDIGSVQGRRARATSLLHPRRL